MSNEASGQPALVCVIVRSVGRPTLERALASIALQDHPAIEVVLVAANGDAHPGLPERCGPFPIRVVQEHRSLKRAEAADAGMRAATGAFITFLDDDDEFLPGHVSGLVQALLREPGVLAVNARALATFASGATQIFGQRFALSELYARNFVSLSMLLFARTLLDRGIAFDPKLPMHEDWDIALQIAQHTRFADQPVASYRWYADIGDSGGGGGANVSDANFALYRDYIYDKWASVSDPFIERCEALIKSASAAANAGQLGEAQARAEELLSISQNDPHALNLLAMLAYRRGNAREALALQMRATEVRPQDADLHYNLGLVHAGCGEREAARREFDEALRLVPGHPRALAKLAALATGAG